MTSTIDPITLTPAEVDAISAAVQAMGVPATPRKRVAKKAVPAAVEIVAEPEVDTRDPRDIPPPLPEVEKLSAADKARYQAWVEDAGVRFARRAGYCEQFEASMKAIFGRPLNGKWFQDSEGIGCRGEKWVDTAGFDRFGFDQSGYDRDGFNKDGLDRLGFNKDGLDAQGVHRDDPSRFRFNLRGYDVQGFDASGMDRDGYRRDVISRNEDVLVDREWLYVWDRNGWNPDGYNRYGELRQELWPANSRSSQRSSSAYDCGSMNRTRKRELLIKWGKLVEVDGRVYLPGSLAGT